MSFVFKSSFSLLRALLAPVRVVEPAVAGVREVVALAGGFDEDAEVPPDVSFSRAFVRERTGLFVCSPSLLKGELTPDLSPASLAEADPPDSTLPDEGRDSR